MTGPCAVSQAVREGRVTQEGTPPHEPKLCRTKPTELVCLQGLCDNHSIPCFRDRLYVLTSTKVFVCTLLRRSRDCDSNERDSSLYPTPLPLNFGRAEELG